MNAATRLPQVQHANNMPVQAPLIPHPFVPYHCPGNRTLYDNGNDNSSHNLCFFYHLFFCAPCFGMAG